jgi:3-oxoacyl-[acyl-carrier protein] reductase
MAADVRLDGLVAYVTGSTRGIGRAVAATLAEAGAAVVVNGFQVPDAPGRYADELKERYGTECLGLVADQRDPDAIKQAYSAIHTTYGRLDILVNNAGIVEDALLGMISERSIANTFDTNALAIVRNMQLASRLMRRHGAGSIINSSSIMGVYGNAGEVVYASAKAAVIGATKAAAKELAPLGIRVNAIAPGFIDTDLTRALAPDVYEARRASIGMGRVGRPEDVANVVLFLAGPLSAYVTGQVIGVDGAMVV